MGFGRSPDHSEVFHCFTTQDEPSPDTRILLIVDYKQNETFLPPFNLESITVHMVMLYDVFLLYETKFTVGKT